MKEVKMFKELNDMDFPDIEPLAIWKTGDTSKKPMWTNPYIKTWFTPDVDSVDYSHHTLHALNDDGLHMVILFKSDWLIERKIKLIDDIDSGIAKPGDVYNTEYIDLEKIEECLKSILTDDFYIPSPCTDKQFKNTKELAAFRSECASTHGQFCFTPVGIKFEKLYQNTYIFNISRMATVEFVKDKLKVEYFY